MDFLTTYIDLMGDLEFLIYVACFITGFVMLFGLIAKLIQSPAVPKVLTTAPQAPEAVPTAAPDVILPAPEPVGEGIMEWGGNEKKAKKAKPAPAPPPAKPKAPSPPVAPPPMPDPSKFDAITKTVVLSPAEAAAVRAPQPESGEKPPVDPAMQEALIRRIAGVEEAVQKEPLFLDPMIKRLSQIEKRIEEMTEKMNAVPPPPPPPSPAPSVEAPPPAQGFAMPDPEAGAFKEEFVALKEKVYGLQKILEHLAEGPTPPTAP
ncbi:MAG: hypothetical protein IPP35_02870 [Elusimicrobia bacterium]|nr:hypothetical protein [Elusimicrobiota bacterium]